MTYLLFSVLRTSLVVKVVKSLPRSLVKSSPNPSFCICSLLHFTIATMATNNAKKQRKSKYTYDLD